MEKLELKAKKINTHNMKKMFPIYKKHKGMFAVTMIFMIMSGIIGILQPIFSANALASLAMGKFEEAVDSFNKVLLRNPDNEDAFFLKEECLDNF